MSLFLVSPTLHCLSEVLQELRDLSKQTQDMRLDRKQRELVYDIDRNKERQRKETQAGLAETSNFHQVLEEMENRARTELEDVFRHARKQLAAVEQHEEMAFQQAVQNAKDQKDRNVAAARKQLEDMVNKKRASANSTVQAKRNELAAQQAVRAMNKMHVMREYDDLRVQLAALTQAKMCLQDERSRGDVAYSDTDAIPVAQRAAKLFFERPPTTHNNVHHGRRSVTMMGPSAPASGFPDAGPTGGGADSRKRAPASRK